uniref:Uncharacterized protein n=1 Tax=Panagrolaimus sp. ES5 TaxID=591445 RepID=A0AC34FG10_9BILA
MTAKLRQHSLSSVRKLQELLHEYTFPLGDASITSPHIYNMETMLETLENLITVHFSTSENVVAEQVPPPRRRSGALSSCRPQCVCSKIKTSYA